MKVVKERSVNLKSLDLEKIMTMTIILRRSTHKEENITRKIRRQEENYCEFICEKYYTMSCMDVIWKPLQCIDFLIIYLFYLGSHYYYSLSLGDIVCCAYSRD